MVSLVALRKESVDRNGNYAAQLDPVRGVALRKESVDRNRHRVFILILRFWSLSARRAWIEISRIIISVLGLESLSARRAWIEIGGLKPSIRAVVVALRKESVDRNRIRQDAG